MIFSPNHVQPKNRTFTCDTISQTNMIGKSRIDMNIHVYIIPTDLNHETLDSHKVTSKWLQATHTSKWPTTATSVTGGSKTLSLSRVDLA